MPSKNLQSRVTIHDIVSSEALHLFKQLAFASAIFLGLMWTALIFTTQIETSDRISSGLAPQMKYLLKTGDTFQIRRSMSALLEGELFDSAILFDAENSKVFSSANDLAANFKTPAKLTIARDGVWPVVWRCGFAPTNGPDYWGALCLAVKPAPKNSIYALLLMALLLLFSIPMWIRHFRRVSTRLAQPILALRNLIAQKTPSLDSGLPSAHIEVTEVMEVYSVFEGLLSKIAETEQEYRKHLTFVAKAQIAEQVAHDIQSPLTALKVAQSSLSTVPIEIQEILSHSIERIRSISTTLTKEYDSRGLVSLRLVDYRNLKTIIRTLIDEKKLEFSSRGIEIELSEKVDSEGLIRIDVVEFQRLLSNLLNNSADAVPAGGSVSVRLRGTLRQFRLSIHDTGPGVPSEMLSSLGQRGLTFGKEKGTGLGLHHARKTIESVGGTIQFSNSDGGGLTIKISLPNSQDS